MYHPLGGQILLLSPAVATTSFLPAGARAVAGGRKTHQRMADVEMRDESVAALPAVFPTPVEVERAVVEQEGRTCAASREVEGSAPASFTHEKTQSAPERTEPIRMETVSAAPGRLVGRCHWRCSRVTAGLDQSLFLTEQELSGRGLWCLGFSQISLF